jgi:hypothetical protein
VGGDLPCAERCLKRITAAGLVKELVDALNAALEKAGLSVKIGIPEDKPELPDECSIDSTAACGIILPEGDPAGMHRTH